MMIMLLLKLTSSTVPWDTPPAYLKMKREISACPVWTLRRRM